MGVIYYLGAPYANSDPMVVQQRVDAIDTFLSHALLAGADVFSPITYGHLMCLRFDLPRSWDFWKRFDLEMLLRSNALLVLRLPGWDVSVGLGEEIKHAQKWGIPIEYIEPAETERWKPWHSRYVHKCRECGKYTGNGNASGLCCDCEVASRKPTKVDYTTGQCNACGALTSNGIGAQYLCLDCMGRRETKRKGES